MSDESASDSKINKATSQRIEAEGDLIVAALSHLESSLPADCGPSWKTGFARQEASLTEWAANLGLLLDPNDLPAKAIRGGQEHDLWFEKSTDRLWKLTRSGVFGLTPGIDLALVDSSEDARRFHLWEANPYQYLERLRLHNVLVPGLNRFEGIITQPGDLSIVTSQPRFDLIPVSTVKIDEWFESLGFKKITDAAYFRESDNLGVFDAHDKNLVHFGDTLIPFDVIPCHPDEGFLEFILEAIQSGHQVRAIRSSTPRK